jgi:hypothetical protein
MDVRRLRPVAGEEPESVGPRRSTVGMPNDGTGGYVAAMGSAGGGLGPGGGRGQKERCRRLTLDFSGEGAGFDRAPGRDGARLRPLQRFVRRRLSRSTLTVRGERWRAVPRESAPRYDRRCPRAARQRGMARPGRRRRLGRSWRPTPERTGLSRTSVVGRGQRRSVRGVSRRTLRPESTDSPRGCPGPRTARGSCASRPPSARGTATPPA